MRSGTARVLSLFSTIVCLGTALPATGQAVKVERLLERPIVVPDMDTRMGANIAGPSVVRVPEWVENRLGQYYLYFADHRGTYIRMAYADALTGPWTMHEPGTLRLEDSYFPTTCPPCGPAGAYVHVASPDVHISESRREFVMYVHGRDAGRQVTRAAVSTDGVQFKGRPEILGRPYFRAFRYDGFVYALAMPGVMYRSRDGLTDFTEGPHLFNPNMRHSALLRRGDRLFVFWTERTDAPERIWVATVELSGDWQTWTASVPIEVLRPQETWEGADLPVEPSRGGSIDIPVNQVRDPAIFEEAGRIYLLYAVAGERGIALAEVHLSDDAVGERATHDLWPATRAEKAGVLAFERAVEVAVLRGDVDFLEEATARDFTYTHGDGWTIGQEPRGVDSRSEWLASLPGRYSLRAVEAQQVEVHGDVAITSGRIRARTGLTAETRRDFTFWFVRVYQRHGDDWKFLSHRTVQGPVFSE